MDTRMADNAKAKLLSVLKARSIPLGLDDIQWAFDSETTKADAVAWIDEYLNDAMLLTKDELSFYESIGDATKLELSTASHEVVPLQDRDIKEAIAALKSSTSAIENHAKALETQKEMMISLAERAGDGNSSEGLAAKYAQDRTSLNFTIEDLVFQVNEQLKEAEEQTNKSLTAVKSFSTERLAADEQVLEALSNLSTKVSESDGPDVNSSDLEKWLSNLASLRAGEVKARIDAMLAAVPSALQAKLGDDGAELQAEISTLKDEIDSVVHMVIGHELRNPLLKRLEASDKNNRQNRQGWSRYLVSTLEYLNSQLEVAIEHISDLRNYADALLEMRSMVSSAEMEASQEINDTATRPSVLANRRIPSGPQAPATTSLLQVLRRLNVKAPESVDAPTLLSQLDTLTAESVIKLQAQYISTEKLILENLGKSLAPKQKDALVVLQQLYASSNFKTLQLTDPELEGRVADLGKKIDNLAPKVARAS